jgi:hypothetical protein
MREGDLVARKKQLRGTEDEHVARAVSAAAGVVAENREIANSATCRRALRHLLRQGRSWGRFLHSTERDGTEPPWSRSELDDLHSRTLEEYKEARDSVEYLTEEFSLECLRGHKDTP